MISVVLSVRNSRQLTANCLQSVLRAFALVRVPVEYLLADDNSDADQNIPGLFADFRREAGAGAKITVLRFKQQQHYTRALAYAFSAAKGRHILFISHDMLLTPDYIRALLGVASLDDAIGLVRGTSNYVDCFPEHKVVPPLPIRSFEDLDGFAQFISQYYGLASVEDRLLTGDSMLIKREAIDKIGVFDPRYFGYFGDIDFGLRLQRAGMKMVCAKGAWLWHEGAAAYKDQAARTGTDLQIIHKKRMAVVNDAYKLFREKWDTTMTPEYPGTDRIDFARLRSVPPLAGGEFQPAVHPDSAICDISTGPA
jgi:GT2 family glycosyltransferase